MDISEKTHLPKNTDMIRKDRYLNLSGLMVILKGSKYENKMNSNDKGQNAKQIITKPGKSENRKVEQAKN